MASPESEMKPSSSLHLMLSSIAQERSKDGKTGFQEDDTFVMVSVDTFWTRLFATHFLQGGGPADNSLRDDMLFYIKKTQNPQAHNYRGKIKTEIEVHRRTSQKLPLLGEPAIDWEETVYLNLILQQFEYTVTCAVCSRTSEKELQILKKFSQQVYPSPSRRRMDSKGTEEEMTYPNIFFTVDNFEEAFGDIIVRDSEMVCVELVANDRHGDLQGVIFLGSIRYDALKRVYDARASLTSRMAQKMSLGWFKGHRRVEFVRMRGPQGKGHAEMAVSRVKGAPETPDTESFPAESFEDPSQYQQRRMSDPSQGLSTFVRGGLRKGQIRKSQSESDNMDANWMGYHEVEAEDLTDEFDDELSYNGFWGRSFGQAWHWFKERRRASCVALNSYLTYVTLPWHRIVADVLEVRQQPILSF